MAASHAWVSLVPRRTDRIKMSTPPPPPPHPHILRSFNWKRGESVEFPWQEGFLGAGGAPVYQRGDPPPPHLC